MRVGSYGAGRESADGEPLKRLDLRRDAQHRAKKPVLLRGRAPGALERTHKESLGVLGCNPQLKKCCVGGVSTHVQMGDDVAGLRASGWMPGSNGCGRNDHGEAAAGFMLNDHRLTADCLAIPQRNTPAGSYIGKRQEAATAHLSKP